MKYSVGGPVPRIFDITVKGVRLTSKMLPELFSQYARHHDKLGLRLSLDWEDEVWVELASQYPKHVKRSPNAAKRRSVSVRQAINFLKFIGKRITDKGLVEPSEAHRRAFICQRCPLSLAVSGCPVCKDAIKWTVTPPEDVSVPEACSACGCWLPGKVWVKKNQLGDPSLFEYHSSCWMLEKE